MPSTLKRTLCAREGEEQEKIKMILKFDITKTNQEKQINAAQCINC